MQVSGHMGLVGGDGEGVGVTAIAVENHENALPVGAGHLEERRPEKNLH